MFSRTLPSFLFVLAFFTGNGTFTPALLLGYGLQRIFIQHHVNSGALFFLSVGTILFILHIIRVCSRLSLLRTGVVTRAGASFSISRKASGTRTYHVHALYDDTARKEHDLFRAYALRSSAEQAVRIPAALFRSEKPTRALLLGELNLPLTYTPQEEIAPLSSGIPLFILKNISPLALALLLVLTISWIEHIARI